LAGRPQSISARVTDLARIPEKLRLVLGSEHWSRARLDAWRRQRLDSMLEAAVASKAWRERIGEPRELSEIPPMDREALRAAGEGLRADRASPTVRFRTSGSMGRPVEVEVGAEQVGYGAAARLRQLSWFGMNPGPQPTANIWPASSAHDPVVERTSEDPPEFRLNHLALSAATLPEAHRELAAVGGIRLIGGTTSMLTSWAALYVGAEEDPRDLGVQLAIVGGEMSYAEDRRIIERTFGCPTADMYGSMEAQMIACECPEGSLHVNEEVVLVEILQPDGAPAEPGERGDVAVTLLHNTEFPIIRYLVGDSAVLLEGSCRCGRTLERLDIDIARLEDLIVCRDGRRLHPRVIRSTYERLLGGRLRSFHTVQEGIGRFASRVSIEGELPPELGPAIEDELSACMGEDVTVAIAADDDKGVERLRSGKLRTFTNRVVEDAAAAYPR
jgi:phenylacetate-CoA ligase